MRVVRLTGVGDVEHFGDGNYWAGIADGFFFFEDDAPTTVTYAVSFAGDGFDEIEVQGPSFAFVYSAAGVFRNILSDAGGALTEFATFTFDDGAVVDLVTFFPESDLFAFQVSGSLLPLVIDNTDFSIRQNGIVSTESVTNPNLQPGDVIDLLTLPGAQLMAHDGNGLGLNAAAGGETLSGQGDDDVINGSFENDRLLGAGGDDYIFGSDGRDALIGEAGDDWLVGDFGDDNISSGEGNDLAYGGDDNDSIGGGSGQDTLYGGFGNDTLGGGSDNDLIEAGVGNDVASSGSGNDTVYGGDGNDTLAGSFGNDRVIGGIGNDVMGGGNNNDYMLGQEDDDDISAGSQNDTLYGFTGNDTLRGGTGNDSLFGEDGADVLNGGGDTDTLTGGEGSDVFQFNRFFGTGTSRITDFEDGVDLIRFLGLGGTPAAAFAALAITQGTGGVLISSVGADILVEGATLAQITAADFLFV